MDIAWTKLLSAIVYPAGIVSLLGLLALLFTVLHRRKLALSLCVLAFGIFFVSSMPYTASRLVSTLERQYPQQSLDQVPQADVIVVLGGGLGLPVRPRQFVQIIAGSDRLWHAARLYKAGKAPRAILTGGNVFPQDGLQGESWYASQLLAEWGIPRQRLLTETESRTTFENAINTRPLLEAMNASRILLVTSGMHMPRALGTFRKALADTGIEVVPCSADIHVTESSGPATLGIVPSPGAMSGTQAALHEYLGQFVYGLRGWL
jgi:uncharacterized SAM-binding protein YcdF (DUF218 family)